MKTSLSKNHWLLINWKMVINKKLNKRNNKRKKRKTKVKPENWKKSSWRTTEKFKACNFNWPKWLRINLKTKVKTRKNLKISKWKKPEETRFSD